MCGIAGLLRPGTAEENEVLARRGVTAIRHRGPDAQGVWSDSHVGLGHARLSIIDLSAAANQPMKLSTLPIFIVFNGEIFNFRELRSELIDLGHQFRTNSDTEVVLAAYAQWDVAALTRLAGMFSLAIWDGRTKRLLLARDRVGIKPLYYFEAGGAVYFASEPKAILAMADDCDRSLDAQAMKEFLWFGNALGARTMFRGIQRLAPGSYLLFDGGQKQAVTFWTPRNVPRVNGSYPDAVAGVRERLRAAVESHLVSDVPVGIFLSGGIDSSAITAFAAEFHGAGLSTFSVAFDFQDANELSYARAVAERYRTRHEELRIAAPDARDLIMTLIRCHDEPFSDAANIPLYLLAQNLDRRVKVVLQGDGGDELFGGYQRYEWLSMRSAPWRLASKIGGYLWSRTKPLPHRLGRVARVVDALGADREKRYALLLTVETERQPPTRVLTADFRDSLARCDPFERYREIIGEVDASDPVHAMLYADTRILLPDTFLEKVDKATMAHGIEVRVPFLDNALIDYALGLPSDYKVRLGQKKRVLRAALRGIVPDDILDRPKTGFGVPYQSWLRGPLREYMLSSIRASKVCTDGIIDFDTVLRVASEHAENKRDHGFLLWKVLNFSLWYDDYRVSA